MRAPGAIVTAVQNSAATRPAQDAAGCPEAPEAPEAPEEMPSPEARSSSARMTQSSAGREHAVSDAELRLQD